MSRLSQNDLMLSILALDAYTRGERDKQALQHDESDLVIGNAIIDQQSHLNLPDDRDVPFSDTTVRPAAIEAGFGATSYSWNGQTVIAYRGTDFDFST